MVAVDVAGGLDAAAAANVTLDWIPGVGEGVIVSTGAYLAGDWLYHHWTPAHDSMDAIADQPAIARISRGAGGRQPKLARLR